VLEAAAIQRWCREALDALGRAREEIDALNVYPVPDGDTGTNLFLTMESAVEEMEARPDDGDLPRTLRALAHGALLGARGNSGVILSELARGAVEALVSGPHEDAEALRHALHAAAEAAYGAVARPVEGTILTVARAAADAAAVAEGDAAAVLRAASRAAHEALDSGPQLLEPLRRAGVVDAGGRGLTILLDELMWSVAGERPVGEGVRHPAGHVRPAPASDGRRDPEAPAFEVMYLLEAGDEAVRALRAELAELGDSLLVVGGDGLWNVHVHVDDAGAAVEAGVRAGRPYRIRVTHFGEQVDRQRAGRGDVGRAVIALLPGPGLGELARGSGAQVVAVTPGRRPSTRDVVDAVQQAHAA
jgi:DAK2 domain fusion protein YloV